MIVCGFDFATLTFIKSKTYRSKLLSCQGALIYLAYAIMLFINIAINIIYQSNKINILILNKYFIDEYCNLNNIKNCPIAVLAEIRYKYIENIICLNSYLPNHQLHFILPKCDFKSNTLPNCTLHFILPK